MPVCGVLKQVQRITEVVSEEMRVGIDITPLAGNRSGVGHFLYYQLTHLLRLASDDCFTAFSSGLHRTGAAFLPGLAAYRHIPVPTRGLYALWSRLAWPAVDRLLGGVDVYHATNYFLPPAATARRVLTIYDLTFLRRPDLCSPKIVGPFRRKVPRMAGDADAILTCSQASKQDIVELLGVPEERVRVAYGAVDAQLKPVPRAEAQSTVKERFSVVAPFVLYAGTIEPRKNVSGLLRAFAHVASKTPHTLVLVGSMGWQPEPIGKTIRDLGLDTRVKWLGYLPRHTDLAMFYSAADAFVFPSFYEGFGLPVLEALACACPVVTSNVSSLPEVAGDAALYVNPEDDGDLAAKLLNVLTNESLRDSLSKRARAQAARFSWDDCARETLACYRSLF